MRCANSACGRAFLPGVAWQVYCSHGCGDRVRHRRAWGRSGPRRPSRRFFRMFLSLIRAADRVRRMRPAP